MPLAAQSVNNHYYIAAREKAEFSHRCDAITVEYRCIVQFRSQVLFEKKQRRLGRYLTYTFIPLSWPHYPHKHKQCNNVITLFSVCFAYVINPRSYPVLYIHFNKKIYFRNYTVSQKKRVNFETV